MLARQRHCGDRRARRSGVRRSKAFGGRNLTQWLALLYSFYRPRRIAERDDSQDLVIIRQPHGLSDTLEAAEPCPVGADAIRPGRQDHRLNGTTDIRNSDRAFLDVGHDNRESRPCRVGTCLYQRAQLAQVAALTDDDEMPGLTVAGAGSKSSCLDNVVHDIAWNRLFLLVSDGQDGAHCLENWVRHTRIISPGQRDPPK